MKNGFGEQAQRLPWTPLQSEFPFRMFQSAAVSILITMFFVSGLLRKINFGIYPQFLEYCQKQKQEEEEEREKKNRKANYIRNKRANGENGGINNNNYFGYLPL